MQSIEKNRVIENIHRELLCYIKENDLRSLVIGISGGIDSALCSTIAHTVCYDAGIPLIGRSLPIESQEEEIKRAKSVGDKFCNKFEEKNLYDMYNAVLKEMKNDFEVNSTPNLFSKAHLTLTNKIRKGNIKARLRMIVLYDLARKHSGAVISTDNYTELLLGFWTLHGDVGDIGPIQSLYKTEVYELAKHMEHVLLAPSWEVILPCIEATPTDGLGITNNDLEQIGAESYEEVDKILQRWMNLKSKLMLNHSEEDKEKICQKMFEMSSHPVIKKHMSTNFKRKNPYNFPRNKIFPQDV